MAPWLLPAMQSGDLQDPSMPRRPPVHTAEQILRDARQKHTDKKSTALNSARKPSYRPVGLSRLQFGDGEFDASVKSFQKFPDPISPGQLPRVRAVVHATRTMSRVVLEKRRASIYGDGEDDGDDGEFENGDEEDNYEDDREGLLAKLMTINNNRGQPISYEAEVFKTADGLVPADESEEILEGSELISGGRQGPVVPAASKAVASFSNGGGGGGSGGSSRFRRFASSQLSAHEGDDRGQASFPAANHHNLLRCVTTDYRKSTGGATLAIPGDDNMSEDVVQSEEQSFVQPPPPPQPSPPPQQQSQLPRTSRFQSSSSASAISATAPQLAVLRPPYNRRTSEMPSDLFEARGAGQTRARSQQYLAFVNPDDDDGGSGSGGGRSSNSNGSVRARIGSCSGVGPSQQNRVARCSSVAWPSIPAQTSIPNSPVGSVIGEGQNTERVNQMLNDLRKLGGRRLDAAAPPGGSSGGGGGGGGGAPVVVASSGNPAGSTLRDASNLASMPHGDGDGTAAAATTTAAVTSGGANPSNRGPRGSSNTRLFNQLICIPGSVAGSEVSDERSASYSQLHSFHSHAPSHSQLQCFATAASRSSNNGPTGLTVRVPQASTAASNSTPGSGGGGGGSLSIGSPLASPGMLLLRDFGEDETFLTQGLLSPTMLQLAASPTLAQLRSVTQVQSSPINGITAAAGRSFVGSPTTTCETALTLAPPVPPPRTAGAPLDGWTNKRPSNHNAVRRTATVSSFGGVVTAMSRQETYKMEKFGLGDGAPSTPRTVGGGDAEDADGRTSRRSAAWRSPASAVSSGSARRIAFEGPSTMEPSPPADGPPSNGMLSTIMIPGPGPASSGPASGPAGRSLRQLFAEIRDGPRRAQSSSRVFDFIK